MSVPLKPAGPLAEKHVNFSNALARAAHDLTLAEKRLIMACIAKGDSVPMEPLTWTDGWTVTLHAADFAETYEIDITTAYEQLMAASKSMFERYVEYTEPGRRGKTAHVRLRWLGKIRYEDGGGWIELDWYKDVVPHLFGLRKEFVSYKLSHAVNLKSVYAWRMYECLRSWGVKGAWAPTIDEFGTALNLPNYYRNNYVQNRTNVIEPAVAELKEKLGMDVKWEARMRGRKVIALLFKFKKTQGKQLALDLT